MEPLDLPPESVPRIAVAYECLVLPDVELSEWRLNLLALSPELDLMFLAVANVIQVRQLAGPSAPPGKLIVSLLQDDVEAQVINQIRTGYIAGRSALMAVDDAGHVFVFWTEAIRQGKYTPAVSLQNDVSTWGLAMCASRPLIAVSANNFRASVWDLERTVLRRGRVELQGHSHNIPCIDFDPSGHLLASVSIDRTVRVWDLERVEMIAQRRIDIHWAWSCRWVRGWDVRAVRVANQDAIAPPAAATELPVLPAVPTGEVGYEDELDEDEDDDDDDDNSVEERLPLLTHDQVLDVKKQRTKLPGDSGETEADREEREARERALRFQDMLILCTDRDHIYLYDSMLNSHARCRFLPEGLQLGGPHRLALVEWIPALSVAVVASQSWRARLIHVQRNNSGTYSLIPGAVIPSLLIPLPPVMLMGLSVSHIKSDISPMLDVWVVHLIYLNGSMYCYELRHPAELDAVDAAAADV